MRRLTSPCTPNTRALENVHLRAQALQYGIPMPRCAKSSARLWARGAIAIAAEACFGAPHAVEIEFHGVGAERGPVMKLDPGRMANRTVFPSALTDHEVASIGTMAIDASVSTSLS